MSQAKDAPPFDKPVSFVAEWYDAVSKQLRKFVLIYHASTVILHEGKKTFLSKTHVPSLAPCDLYIGSVINILGRQMQLLDYADGSTRTYLSAMKMKGFALVLPGEEGIACRIAEFLSAVQEVDAGILISQMRTVDLKDVHASSSSSSAASLPPAVSSAVASAAATGRRGSTEMLAVEVVTDSRLGGWGAWRVVCEQFSSQMVYYSATPAEAEASIDYFFGDDRPKTSADTSNNSPPSTLLLVKPHVLKQGKLAALLNDIGMAGLHIKGLEQMTMDMSEAIKFFEPYQDIFTYHRKMLDGICEGPCVALQITEAAGNSSGGSGGGSSVIDRVRALCGPVDPELARVLRPDSLRAKYGESRPYNAVHCTDLPGDGLLEVTYFFQALLN